jgi:hypothetical protein
MPEKVIISKELRVINIRSIGVVTVEDLKQSLSEIIKLKKESKFNRIFVDHQEATFLPTSVPAFNFGADISRLLIGTSIALVTSHRTEYDINFFRDVVNARGGNVHVFNSEAPALQWLSRQPE